MPLKMNGSTSGYTQIQAAATAGNNTLTLPTSGTNLLADNGSGALTIQTINSGSSNALTLQSNNATALYIDTSQNVGIGTTSPSTKLTVSTAATTDAVRWTDNTNSTGILSTTTGASTVWSTAALAFGTGAVSFTERARIDTSGNLLVGTTSAQAKFVTNSATSGASAKVITSFSGDVSTAALILQKNDNNTTTSQVFAQFLINSGSNGSGQINANGASAAAFGSYSDERLKENIVNLPSQLANICALRPVEFDYKDGSGHQIGFIAQEMQEVYPDVVSTGADDMLTVTGWSKTEARLVKALQEAVAKIDALETRIAKLEIK